MASNNEAKVRFTAETSDFTSAIKDANSEMQTLRAEMKLNEAQFQNTGNETEYLSQKSQLLEAQLDANAEKQEALTQKLEAAKSIYGEDSEEVAKLERQLIYAQTEEEKLKTQLEQTSQGLTDQAQAADEAGSSMEDMAQMVVASEVASAVKEIAQAALDMAEAFDEASATIVEGTGASGEALADLNQQAQDAFGRIADADQDINGVSGILAELNTRFGLTGDELEDLTVKMANFSQHTDSDGVGSVDNIANVMKRWGMDMSDIDNLLDDLTTANQSCQMSTDELTRYLSENSVQFQELGFSSEEALATLISLSDGGANVSSVMSGMKKAVGNLSEVTDDVPGAFNDAITAISECDSVSEALQAQVGDTGLTVEEVFGSKAAQELATNVQNGNFNIEQWTQVLRDNQGALQETTDNATTMQDAWAQASNGLKTAFAPVAEVIAEVGTEIAEVISSVAEFISQSPVAQSVVVALATAFGIFAGVLAIGATITAVTSAIGALSGVMTVLTNPVFLVIAAIAALAAGLIYAYKHSETFRNIVNSVFNTIKTVVLTVIQTVTTVIRTAVSTVSSLFNSAKNTITSVFNAIRSVTTSVWNAIKNAITNPVQTARSVVTSIFNGIRSTISGVVNGVKSTVSSAFNAIKSNMTKPIETAKSTIQGIMNKIKGIFPLRIGRIFTGLSLPHISVSGGKAPFGIGGKGSLPHFSVSWHAQGVVFDAPTLFPTLSGWHGVGEAGPEAVSPISTLQEYISTAVAAAVPTPKEIDYEKLAATFTKMNTYIELDGREMGRAVRAMV